MKKNWLKCKVCGWSMENDSRKVVTLFADHHAAQTGHNEFHSDLEDA